jgi:hypothetical protein
MSKKKNRKSGRQSGQTGSEVNNLKLTTPLIILALLLTTTVTFGAITYWRGAALSSSRPAVVMPSGTPDYSANKPAKEFIYAGGKLLATNEPETPSDLAVWRRASGTWFVLQGESSNYNTQVWGNPTDEPVSADYDGDDKVDFAVFRPSTATPPSSGTWYIIQSSSNTMSAPQFGLVTDKLAPADYDGDGKADVAIYRPSTGEWFISKSSNSSLLTYQFGNSSDKPVPGDYDGDGKADPAVWRSSDATWYTLQTSNNAVGGGALGQSSDQPVPGDYDGDGKIDMANWASNGVWTIRRSSTGQLFSTASWGNQASDIPVQADYDGDGVDDIAVWRPSNGTWYIKKSAGGERITQWGSSGDVPVPGIYQH